ncbi:Histone-lysine N-methyltransferase SETMAR [Ooceraea biroi]|uniref:Histone-lysine N-methyltransferase SETMAR n=1 Tax=Ooceraea biroi TaxID=2015173 RepID=A0A026WEQ2_OOCBI|nr:Histone-lysine N-methyltransferase SETMAR [Ooceraea biroi]
MPILLHDNARPHTARLTVAKLQELELETLRHPPYSPDLSPTDYHFFRNLDNLLVGKFFNNFIPHRLFRSFA